MTKLSLLLAVALVFGAAPLAAQNATLVSADTAGIFFRRGPDSLFVTNTNILTAFALGIFFLGAR